jgi:hypothetical protein
VAFLGWRYLHLQSRIRIWRATLLFLPVHVEDDLLSGRSEARALRDVATQQLKTFQTVNQQAHVPTFEHIGEAVPSRNGSCAHAPHAIFGLKERKQKNNENENNFFFCFYLFIIIFFIFLNFFKSSFT